MTRLQQLATELRRRRVFRSAGIYVVAAWVAIQVASLLFPAANIPDSALLYVWMAAVFLFPLVIVFAWHFDLSAAGLTRTLPASVEDTFDPSLRRTDYVILSAISLVAISVAWLVTTRIEPVSDLDRGALNPNSIAVLPFDNISGDPEQEYFASGMQAAMIGGLSRIRGLRVTSKTSTLRYRNSGDSLPEIGQQLRVAKIIEGSIYRFNNRVRLQIQLLDAAKDEHIWSATFEDEIEDIVLLQGKVAQAIANQTRITLSPAELAQIDDVAKVNPAAYEAFLKGQFHVERFTPADMALAAGYFQEASVLDPDYALGYWGLSKLCGFQAQSGFITPQQAHQQCLPPILRALDLDPLLPEAHMGYASQMTWQHFDWESADAAFQRAIELNPSYAEAHMFYSHYLAIVGRAEESADHIRLAVELDPLNPFVRALHSAQLMLTNELEQAVAVAEDVISSAPGFGFGHEIVWLAQHTLGNQDETIRAAVNFFRYTRGYESAAQELETKYDGTNYSESLTHTAEFLTDYSKTTYVLPTVIGILYEQAGEIENAIDWFETAFHESAPDAPYTGARSHTLEINAHPRFQQLLRDMKLDYWANKFSESTR
jgi:adenylate cyclase